MFEAIKKLFSNNQSKAEYSGKKGEQEKLREEIIKTTIETSPGNWSLEQKIRHAEFVADKLLDDSDAEKSDKVFKIMSATRIFQCENLHFFWL